MQTSVYKCQKCGKEIEIPFLKTKELKQLYPFCATNVILHVQFAIHSGWHVRNLGVTDTHPFFCSDCWDEGTPEYHGFPEDKVWIDQCRQFKEETK